MSFVSLQVVLPNQVNKKIYKNCFTFTLFTKNTFSNNSFFFLFFPDQCSPPVQIRASGGAVEIAWLAPYNTGGIALSQFFLYQGSTVADFGPVKEVQNEKYRVPNYKPNTKEIFVLGGLSPFRKYKFSIEYSNVAET